MIEPKKIIRSKRRTVSLIIDKDGDLIVRAPLKVPMKFIMDFVCSKQDWIEKNHIAAQKRRSKFSKINCCDGEKIYFLGKCMYIYSEKRKDIAVTSDSIIFPSDSDRIVLLVKWYRAQARDIFGKRVQYFSEIMKVTPQSIKLSDAKKRFGSCSGNNNINLSWRLVMCSCDIIDYVIVHELSHIIFKNHSSSFWNNVEKYMPDYKEKRNWLKENGSFMDIV